MAWGILGDDAMFIMELEVFEPELYSMSVGCRFCVFTRVYAEEECNLDVIGLTFFKGGGVYCCSSLDDNAKGGCLFMFGWGVLVRVVMELMSELLVKILGGGALGLTGVRVTFQEVGLGDSMLCRSNRVYPESCWE